MCTDLKLVRMHDHQVSARTLDFAYELNSRLQVVPAGSAGEAVPTGTEVPAHHWTTDVGFVGMDAFGFDWVIADGLNETGLSVATLWLPETRLPTTAPEQGETPAMDFVNLARWLLGTCRTVEDTVAALQSVQIWNPALETMWPKTQPMPEAARPLTDYSVTEHLSIHDARGRNLVVEFIDDGMRLHDNPIGVLTNSPTYDWHTTNLRNYLGLTNQEHQAENLTYDSWRTDQHVLSELGLDGPGGQRAIDLPG